MLEIGKLLSLTEDIILIWIILKKELSLKGSIA